MNRDDIPESEEVQRQADPVAETMWQLARDGHFNVRWNEETGEALFSLTELGKRASIELIRDLAAGEGGDQS